MEVSEHKAKSPSMAVPWKATEQVVGSGGTLVDVVTKLGDHTSTNLTLTASKTWKGAVAVVANKIVFNNI